MDVQGKSTDLHQPRLRRRLGAAHARPSTNNRPPGPRASIPMTGTGRSNTWRNTGRVCSRKDDFRGGACRRLGFDGSAVERFPSGTRPGTFRVLPALPKTLPNASGTRRGRGEGGRKRSARSERAVPGHLRKRRGRHRQRRFRGPLAARQPATLRHCRLHSRGTAPEKPSRRSLTPMTWPSALRSSSPFTQGEIPTYSLEKRYPPQGRLDRLGGTGRLAPAGTRRASPAYAIVMFQDISGAQAPWRRNCGESEQPLAQPDRGRCRNWFGLQPPMGRVTISARSGRNTQESRRFTCWAGSGLENAAPGRPGGLPPGKSGRTRLRERGPYDVEYRVRPAGMESTAGSKRVACQSGTARGPIFKWFGTCTDITDGKAAAEELRLAKEVAESANRAQGRVSWPTSATRSAPP